VAYKQVPENEKKKYHPQILIDVIFPSQQQNRDKQNLKKGYLAEYKNIGYHHFNKRVACFLKDQVVPNATYAAEYQGSDEEVFVCNKRTPALHFIQAHISQHGLKMEVHIQYRTDACQQEQ
jgi:hypothetical protein